MFGFLKKLLSNKSMSIDKKTAEWNGSLEELKISASIDDNIATMKTLFCDMDMMRYKEIHSSGEEPIRYFLVFCDGVVNSEIINDNIVKPLMHHSPSKEGALMDVLLRSVIDVGESKTTDNFKSVVENVTYGDTILFVDGCSEAAILNSKQFSLRAVSEPENEKTLGGPRDGFTESLAQNLSQIVRRLRTNECKTKVITMGRRTQTSVCICYIDSIVNKNILKELYRRLEKIDIDGVLDQNYIAEQIRDHPYSTFRTTGYTERPDVIVGKMLEGHIAILVDGSPTALTLPYLFIENFQSNEDYYFNFFYTSFSRMLRIGAFLITVSIPAFYIAIVAFHQEMLPIQLLMRVALERQSVPFPAAVEAFIMLLVFDILRETGIRMPASIGQPLSIVGALVIGQAAVEASLVAAPMIIVVAAAGITGLLVPRLNSPIIFWRLALLMLASSFGFFGLTIGLSLLFIHICNLTSFGVDQVLLKGSFKFQEMKDIFIRAPWTHMIDRPGRTASDKVRQARGNDDE